MTAHIESECRSDAAATICMARHRGSPTQCGGETLHAYQSAGNDQPAPDNLLNRDFRASAPNEKWLTDVTEFQIPAGKVYFPMIDRFDGMVVSWSIGTRPDAALVNTMLDAAIETVAASSERPVVHSDRGGHYRWPGWLTGASDAKLVRMSRKGCSPDIASGEGFFGRLKNELFEQIVLSSLDAVDSSNAITRERR